jgi:hypothetical protein
MRGMPSRTLVEPLEPPSRALSRLREACGPLPGERLFATRAAWRPAGDGRTRYTPDQVLAFGDSEVSLWTDDGHAGTVVTIPIDRLLAVDDRQILLYGRLRLVAADAHVVVRYNTVYREYLEASLCDLRARMTQDAAVGLEDRFVWLGPGCQDDEGAEPELPHKWRVVLDHPGVRLDPSLPAMIAVGDVLAERLIDPPITGVAVLGPRELVIASEPASYLDVPGRFGVDILAVPRGRLDSFGWDGKALTARFAIPDSVADRAWVTLNLDPYLVEAMRRAFGSAVHWL